MEGHLEKARTRTTAILSVRELGHAQFGGGLVLRAEGDHVGALEVDHRAHDAERAVDLTLLGPDLAPGGEVVVVLELPRPPVFALAEDDARDEQPPSVVGLDLAP